MDFIFVVKMMKQVSTYISDDGGAHLDFREDVDHSVHSQPKPFAPNLARTSILEHTYPDTNQWYLLTSC